MASVALIYTGHLRTWNQCVGNHHEFIFQPETHAFFYTYDRPAWDNHYHRSKLASFQWVGIPESFYPDPHAPHKYDSRKVPENTVYNTLNQWLNNFVGFRMVPKGFDIYVRIRPDIKFNGPLDFNQYDCTGNNIYIPQGFDYGGVCDQFAFGSYEVMKAYYSVFLKCHEYWENGTTWQSELMQLVNLQHHGINIIRPGSPQIDLIR